MSPERIGDRRVAAGLTHDELPVAAPPRRPSEVWVQTIDRGLFCKRHFSWLCGCGSGRCQEEFFDLLVRVGREAKWQS